MAASGWLWHVGMMLQILRCSAWPMWKQRSNMESSRKKSRPKQKWLSSWKAQRPTSRPSPGRPGATLALEGTSWNLHLTQNAIMTDAKRLHGEVFRTLKFAGATFLRVGVDLEDVYTCVCGRSFDTNRGLLAHQRRAHQIFSLERPFLQGCTCLHCGKFLWSTQRLQQHLAYIPKGLGYNPCYYALVEQGRQVRMLASDLSSMAFRDERPCRWKDCRPTQPL